MAALWLLNHVLFFFFAGNPLISLVRFYQTLRAKGFEKFIRKGMEFVLSPLAYLIGSIAQKKATK